MKNLLANVRMKWALALFCRRNEIYIFYKIYKKALFDLLAQKRTLSDLTSFCEQRYVHKE